MNGGRFHTLAFSQTTGAAITNTAVNGVPDGQLTLSTATTFLTPKRGKIVLAAGFGATITRARLNMPSLRTVGLPSIVPINVSATIPSPVNVWNMVNNPIDYPSVEPLSVEGTDTAIDTITIPLWIHYGNQPVPVGDRYRLRGTSAITAAVNAWASGSIALDQPLQQGRYAVVGLDVVAADTLAARLLFADGGFRPGCLTRNTIGQVPHPIFTDGRLGVYGEFDNATIPNLELLGGAGAGAVTAEVFLDLIRLGNA